MEDPQVLREALDELYRQRHSRVWILEMALAPCVALFGAWAFDYMWRRPIVTTGELGTCALIIAVGGYMFFDAWDKRRAQSQLKEQVAKVYGRSLELIEGIRRVRKDGGNMYEYLVQEGITQPDIRKYLIDRAKRES